MCCVLQGAERVFPSGAGARQGMIGDGGPGARGDPSSGSTELPLESLWAAGLDEGMGFPRRCSYAHHGLASIPNHSNNPDELWRDRKLSYNRTPTVSTGVGSSLGEEIWTTSAAEHRRIFRTSTASSGGLGSALNLLDHQPDFYSTDVEDAREPFRRYYPCSTPTTSGLGSSCERQSIETRNSRAEFPDHLWANDDSASYAARLNAALNGSLQRGAVTRQPRPNHDWVRTERVSRFNKHRTISQSPRRDEPETWSSRFNEITGTATTAGGYATHRHSATVHKCHHQARRSFSTSVVADLALPSSPRGSQQSLGSREFMVSLDQSEREIFLKREGEQDF